MDKPVSKDPHSKGFALVVTLSLMILLTIIAVGLLSLSVVTLRSSSREVAQAEAQANARMALMLAIGELQKQLGPDQRVSANGAILATTTVQHPNWAGVWNSWQAGTRAAGTTSPDTPSEHRTILGASSATSPPCWRDPSIPMRSTITPPSTRARHSSGSLRSSPRATTSCSTASTAARAKPLCRSRTWPHTINSMTAAARPAWEGCACGRPPGGWGEHLRAELCRGAWGGQNR